MERCELCKCLAEVYCESDQASLCWNCDAKVHSANFLAAKHLRCLLCKWCKTRTPWNACGQKLGRIASFCDTCVLLFRRAEGCGEGGEGNNYSDSECSGSEYEDEDRSGEEIDIDNQVVSWPPPAASCSSGSTK